MTNLGLWTTFQTSRIVLLSFCARAALSSHPETRKELERMAAEYAAKADSQRRHRPEEIPATTN
jgi:hypothetical protein